MLHNSRYPASKRTPAAPAPKMTSDEMLQQLMMQQLQAGKPKFTDYLSLIMGGAGLLGQGLQGSRSTRLQEQENALRERADQYNREERARAANLLYASGRSTDDFDRASIALGAQPLGGELGFVQRQNLIGNMIGQQQVPQTALGGGSAFDPFTGMSREPYSNTSTASGLAQRRRALAAVNPDINFGSLAGYGLGDAAISADSDVAAAVAEARARRKAQDDATRALLDAQTAAALQFSTPANAPGTTTTAAPKKKGGGFWSKLGKIASVAAPIIAAPFTGGASLALIGAGAGALGGLASGGGLKGALMGAGMGAIPLPGGGGLNAARQAGTITAKESLKRAILNPNAIARLTGAAVGGRTEDITNLITPFLQGARIPTGPTINRLPSMPGAPAGAPTIPFVLNKQELLPLQSGRVLGANTVLSMAPSLRAQSPMTALANTSRMRNVVAPTASAPLSTAPASGPFSIPRLGDPNAIPLTPLGLSPYAGAPRPPATSSPFNIPRLGGLMPLTPMGLSTYAGAPRPYIDPSMANTPAGRDAAAGPQFNPVPPPSRVSSEAAQTALYRQLAQLPPQQFAQALTVGLRNGSLQMTESLKALIRAKGGI